jgi:aromatic-L-amino-acid/L-tryptophan decarboxylase
VIGTRDEVARHAEFHANFQGFFKREVSGTARDEPGWAGCYAAASYAYDVSEADASAAREDELQAFRNASHALVESVADHLAALPSQPVWQPLQDAQRRRLLDLPLPEHSAMLDDLVATMSREVLPHAMGNGHPAFFGWVNSPPSLAGVVASLAAAAMNPSVVAGDHADVHIERAVVRWLAELVGFPHAPGAGLLTSGGSAATIVCFAGARGRALAAAGHDVRRDGLAGAPQLIAYVPTEAHSCVQRALELLGVGRGAMREVPLAGGRLDAAALRASIAADRARGAVPALLVGSAGTVNAGLIDPLEALADTAAAEGLWFHVDGAYGALGVLDPAIAARYRGMERADSLVLDPHKWLGVPVDAGCALVQRADDLRDAFSLIPPYLRQGTDAPVGTFAEYGLEQTRPFRALKAWATIAARGRAGIAAQVVRANELARELAALVEGEPELELAAAPETSIVAFRARPAGCPPARLDDVNRALPEAVQARGRAFVTGTVFGGRETLRACILHPETGTEELATLVAEVVAAARTLTPAG